MAILPDALGSLAPVRGTEAGSIAVVGLPDDNKPLIELRVVAPLYSEEVVAAHGSIATNRLLLRLVSPVDAQAFSELMHPAAEAMLASWPYPLSPRAAEAKLDRAVAETNARRVLAYSVLERSTGRLAGWCSATRWHEAGDDTAMLTYWVGTEFEGRGFVIEAIRAAAPHMVSWIGVAQLGAGALEVNERSLRTMQRAGLRTPDRAREMWCEGRARHETMVCYAASREEVMGWSALNRVSEAGDAGSPSLSGAM